MDYERDADEVLGALKGLLREKNLKYAELSDRLGVSLPTVKRWMNSTNISIRDLCAICSAIGVRPEDLLSRPPSGARAETFELTLEQELFMARHPGHLAYFDELRRGAQPEEIEERHGISRKSTELYLKGLEGLGLVKRGKKGAALPVTTAALTWGHLGPLGKVFSKQMLRGLADRMLEKFDVQGPGLLSLWGRSLTPGDLEELKRELRALEDKYRSISNRNRRVLPPESLVTVSAAIMIDEWDAQIFRRIEELAH